MAHTLDEVIAGLSAAQRSAVDCRAAQLLAEELAQRLVEPLLAAPR